MAAPSVTARSTPAGIPLDQGYQSLVAFSLDPDISVWEKLDGVGLPGINGGEPINISTMHNTTWHTMVARALKTLTPFTLACFYDPDCYNQINAILNDDSGSITIHFPDGSTLAFWGYVQKAEFGALQEGTPPEITLTIVPTNYDKANRVEAAPVLTSVAGT